MLRARNRPRTVSAFDFDAAVQAPFRMQPGMRRLAAGSPQLTPLSPGSRHQREKLAVLCAFPGQALLALLCAVANPVDHTFCADERLSAHLAGNREVVALLWRYGACTNSVPEPQNT